MLRQVAELIDHNGPRIAQEWLEALQQSGNRILREFPQERLWQLALNWSARLLEAMRSGDLTVHQNGFSLTAKRLSLEGLPASDTIELISMFKRILWRLLEGDGTRRKLSAANVMRELEPYFDSLSRQLVLEQEQAWQCTVHPELTQDPVVQRARELSQEAEDHTLIARLSQEIAAEHELPRLLRAVIRNAAQLAGASKGGLALLDQHRTSFRYQAGYHLSRSEAAGHLAPGEGLTGLAVASGEPQVVTDLTQHPESSVREQAARLGVRSGVSIPLAYQGMLIGTLDLFDKLGPEQWTDRDLRLLQDLAEHAAPLITNVQLWHQADARLSHRHLVDLADLTWVGEKIGSTLDLDTILGTVVQAVVKATEAPLAVVILPGPDGDLVIPAHGYQGLDNQFAQSFHLSHDDPSFADAFAGQPQLVTNLDTEQADRFPLPGVRSFVCVPLSVPEQPTGLMIVADWVPREFQLHQVAVLSAYANQAALALYNAQMYADAVSHLEQLSTVFEVTKTLSSTLDLHEALNRLLQAALRLLRAPAGTIWLLDAERSTISMAVAQGLGEDHHFPTRLKVGEGIHGIATAQGVPFAIRELAKDGRVKGRTHFRLHGLHSMLAAPLMTQGKVAGVIAVYTTTPRDFSQAEITLLSTLGNEAGIAIENSRLYEQERERVQFLADLMGEMDHRVKNNLQTIVGLLELQLSHGGHSDITHVVRDSIKRIRSIALAHEMIAQGELKQVDIKEIARRIIEISRHGATSSYQQIKFQVSGTRIMLPSKAATSLALVINEAVTNALEHAFVGRTKGAITISLQEDAGHILVQIHDDGAGLPAGFDPLRSGSLGMQIIRGLTTQDLGGELTINGQQGTTIRIRLSK